MKKLLALFLTVILVLAAMPVIGVSAAGRATFSVGNATGAPGDEVTVPVSIDTNPGLTFATVMIGYDAEALEIVNIEKLTLAGKPAKHGPLTSNPIVVTWADGLADTTDTGVIANITFKIKDDAATGDYTLTVEGVQENTFNLVYEDVPFTTVNGTITVESNTVEPPVIDGLTFIVGNATGAAGEEVVVPVEIAGNPGITFAQVMIGYDAEALEIVNIEKLTLAGKPTSHGPLTYNPIAITWADGLVDTTENGVIANITFRIKDGASGTYTLTAEGVQENTFNLAYEDVPFTTVNGAIEVHNHDWVEVVEDKYLATEATCQNRATYYKSCSVCDKASDVTFETGELAGHTIAYVADDLYLATWATCIKKATYYASCLVCGEQLDETFESGGFDYNNHAGRIMHHPAVEPTCEDIGWSAYTTCTACDLIRNPITKPALGHNYTQVIDAEYIAVEATCTSKALYYYSCSRCGKASNETFEAGELLDHTYDTEYDYTCNVCQFSRAPHAPTLAYKYSSTIALNAVEGLEYSCDGIKWQTSPIFENLTENTEYTFIQRVKASSTAQQSEASETLKVYLKLSQATPSAPMISSFTDTVIKLFPISNGEYSIDGINWQSSAIFENLQPATEYKLYQRCAETETHEQSHISACETIVTDKAKQKAIPSAPVVESYTDHSITLVAVDGCEYSMDGKNWQSSTVFNRLLCGTEYSFYQRYKETDTHYAGNKSEKLIAKTDKGTQYAPSAPTLLRATSSKITLVAIEGYEYSRDGVNWQSSNVFENLDSSTSYLFYQRKAETDTHYASEKSERLIAKTSEITTGDANGDGVVTGKDYTVILQSINGWQITIDIAAADVNGDGVVNGKDYTTLLQYINGWDVKLY